MRELVQHFEVLDSTQEVLKKRYQKKMISEDCLHWISCDFQSQGRGRMGRSWQSEHGTNLLISVALKMKGDFPPNSYSFFPFLALLSLCEALSEVAGPGLFESVFVKWPNDLMFFDKERNLKKISGVLVESKSSGLLVCGWGVNVSKNDFERAVSIEEILNRSIPISTLSLALQNNFKKQLQLFYSSPEKYQKEKITELNHKWMQKFWGQRVFFQGEPFVALRLLEEGSLEVRKENSGEIFKISSAQYFEMI